MTYIVNDKCIGCKYTDCVDVCPVDCFYEGENMLVIHPDECIDCGVCEPDSEVSKDDFQINDFVVYPSHGVGRIVDEEIQNVAGFELKMYVLSFDKDKMTLKVPKNKIESTGMRKLSSPNTIGKALQVIGGKAKVKRAMWSRRAQDYEQKINSGELILIAEVVRDLHRNDEQREQSYSERQLYEAALERLTREIAAVDGVEERKAQEKVDKVLDGKAA